MFEINLNKKRKLNLLGLEGILRWLWGWGGVCWDVYYNILWIIQREVVLQGSGLFIYIVLV